MMKRRFYPAAISATEWEWFSKVQQQTAMDSLLDAADLLMRTDLTNELSRIVVPTLLLAPDASPFVPLEIPTQIHKLIADSEVASFPRSRHGLPFSHAKVCAETLLAFLRRRASNAEPLR